LKNIKKSGKTVYILFYYLLIKKPNDEKSILNFIYYYLLLPVLIFWATTYFNGIDVNLGKSLPPLSDAKNTFPSSPPKNFTV